MKQKPQQERITIAYARLSKPPKKKRVDEALSIDAQLTKMRQWGAAHGIALREIADNFISGKNLKRPGVEELIRECRSGRVERVVVCKLDRLSRSVKDAIDLMDLFSKCKVVFVSLNESFDSSTPYGEVFMNMIVSFSQLERRMIGERTREVLEHKRSLGERLGNIPYGQRVAADGVMLEDDLEELGLVMQMRDLRASGMSLREIATTLNDEGLRTRSGGEWRFQYVANILKGTGE